MTSNEKLITEYLNTAIFAVQQARDFSMDEKTRRELKLIKKWLYILRGED